MQYSRRRHRQSRRSATASVLLLAGAAALAACTSQPRVSAYWQDGATRGPAFSRVLIVGVTPNVNQRCAFEFFLVSQLKSDSVKPIRSCDVVKEKNPLTVESITEAVAAQQIDAVIATSLVAHGWGVKEGGNRDTRGGGMYKATDMGYASSFYGAYGIPVVYGEFQTAPSITTLEGKVTVETRVFETKGATLVYTMETSVQNLESRDEALASIAQPIAKRLRSDGLGR